MSFFTLGLEKVKIYNNREWLTSAEFKFYSFVSDERLEIDGIDDFLNHKDNESKRKEILDSVIKKNIDTWKTIEISDVPDRHTFLFGDTGKILYKTDYIPDFLDWFLVAVESDQDIRNLGSTISNNIIDNKFSEISSKIFELVGSAATPQINAGIYIANEVCKTFSSILKNNKDDLAGLIDQSFIRIKHYPQGSRHKEQVQDVTGNMWYDYFIYGLDEVSY